MFASHDDHRELLGFTPHSVTTYPLDTRADILLAASMAVSDATICGVKDTENGGRSILLREREDLQEKMLTAFAQPNDRDGDCWYCNGTEPAPAKHGITGAYGVPCASLQHDLIVASNAHAYLEWHHQTDGIKHRLGANISAWTVQWMEALAQQTGDWVGIVGVGRTVIDNNVTPEDAVEEGEAWRVVRPFETLEALDAFEQRLLREYGIDMTENPNWAEMREQLEREQGDDD
jgi:hypothetical protein